MKKVKESNISNVIIGVVIGIIISTICFIIYSRINKNDHSNYLAGGWVLSSMTEQNDIIDPNTPHSLNFNKNTVTITTVDGEEIECSYSFDSSGMDHILKIFNFPGVGDIELYVSLQPLLHIKNNSGTILDGQYLFAG